MKGKIIEMLKKYSALQRISFSMPGHKNGKGLEFCWGGFDVTELPDTDNLHHSDGAAKEACKKISRIYGSDESFILVNGSTGGIFTMLASVCKRGDKILISRISHMSVVNACVALGLEPVFFTHKIYEKYSIAGEADIEDLKSKIDDNIKAVLVTSPNYFGVVSDIKRISDILKNKKIPLLVDEAHGAHFVANGNFPIHALALGADMVVESTHKTLNGLNQSALLHVKSDLVDYERIKDVLTFFQTSSPSYLIAASAENATVGMEQDKWENVLKKCCELKENLKKNTCIKIPNKEDGFFELDETRLVFNFSEYETTGYDISEQLRKKWNIDIEMADSENIVLIATPANFESDFKSLEDGLVEIVGKLKKNEKKMKFVNLPDVKGLVINPSDAFYSESEYIELEKCHGRISVKTVIAYPPGVPILVPGEKIEKENIEYLKNCGGDITGMKDGKLKVIKEGLS